MSFFNPNGLSCAHSARILFFHFQAADTGMVMLIPGVRGEGDVMRFQTGGLANSQNN
jgi:hypothetical protein